MYVVYGKLQVLLKHLHHWDFKVVLLLWFHSAKCSYVHLSEDKMDNGSFTTAISNSFLSPLVVAIFVFMLIMVCGLYSLESPP